MKKIFFLSSILVLASLFIGCEGDSVVGSSTDQTPDIERAHTFTSDTDLQNSYDKPASPANIKHADDLNPAEQAQIEAAKKALEAQGIYQD